ncbi:MAG: glutamine synthetase type III, partial [Leptolyngbyaceae bacterium]|nr:glutamine synthetase type III [Leptolyngbyaceae bacterium]
PTTADALPYLTEEFIEDLFKKTGVLTPVELESRYEVYSEQYILSIEVEAKLVISMAKTLIYPAAVGYLSKLSSTIASLTALGITLEQESAKTVADLANSMIACVSKLSSAMETHDFGSTAEHMQYCAKTIRPLMDEVREYADAIEGAIADEFWPLPTYEEMLFIK